MIEVVKCLENDALSSPTSPLPDGKKYHLSVYATSFGVGDKEETVEKGNSSVRSNNSSTSVIPSKEELFQINENRLEIKSKEYIKSQMRKESRNTAVEQMLIMRRNEKKYYSKRTNYFNIFSNYHRSGIWRVQNGMIETINDTWRAKMCQWSFMVADYLKVDRRIVEVAFNLLDRYLSAIAMSPKPNQVMDEKLFQQIAATTLYVAIKLHGDLWIVHDCTQIESNYLIEMFVHLSRGLFTSDDICKLELKLCDTLGWHLNAPTAVSYAEYLLNLELLDNAFTWYGCNVDIETTFDANNYQESIFQVSKELIEVAVGDYELFLSSTPSCIAVAAIVCALSITSKGRMEDLLVDEFIENAAKELVLGEGEINSLAKIQNRFHNFCK